MKFWITLTLVSVIGACASICLLPPGFFDIAGCVASFFTAFYIAEHFENQGPPHVGGTEKYKK